MALHSLEAIQDYIAAILALDSSLEFDYSRLRESKVGAWLVRLIGEEKCGWTTLAVVIGVGVFFWKIFGAKKGGRGHGEKAELSEEVSLGPLSGRYV